MPAPNKPSASKASQQPQPRTTPRPSAGFWRGDVLQLLVDWGSAAAPDVAAISGFRYQPQEEQPAREQASAATAATPATPIPPPSSNRRHARHYSASLKAENPAAQSTLAQQSQLLSVRAELPELPPPSAAPAWQALSSKRRLVVMAEKYLRTWHASSQWDCNKLAKQLAQGLPPKPRALRLQRLRWRGNAMLISMCWQTEALHDDYRALAELVTRRSAARLPVYLHYQERAWFHYQASASGAAQWLQLEHPPQLAGLRGLAVGVPDQAAIWQTAWQPSALLAAWLPPQAASPAAHAAHTALPCALWDKGSPLYTRRQTMPMPCSSAQLRQLLALLCLAVYVETTLLRALRLLLGAPASLEVEVWASTEVAGNRVAIALRKDRREDYIAILQNEIALPLRQQAAELIAAHHGKLSFEIALEEAQLAKLYAPGAKVLDPSPWFAALAYDLAQGKASALSTAADDALVSEQRAYLARQGGRTVFDAWQSSTEFTLAWAMANPDAVLRGQGLPASFDLRLLPTLRKILAAQLNMPAEEQSQGLRLLQINDELHLQVCSLQELTTPSPFRAQVLAQWPSSLVLRWRGGQEQSWQGPIAAQALAKLDLSRHTPLEIEDGSQHCVIREEARPRWALEWGRDSDGLYVLAPNPWGEPVRVAWPLNGQVNGQVQALDFAVPSVQKNSPANKSWLGKIAQARIEAKASPTISALRWEIDSIGPLASLSISSKHGEHSQAFRYIAPGQFLMGSPEQETQGLKNAENYEDERPQHMVTISSGFWLTDTACTQGFWQALMGENPSEFNAIDRERPLRPVERVSWDMIQPFLRQLASLLPACAVTLPTEAEWEYACRAGGNTPFSFGATIHPTQVNCDSNYPYGDGEMGEYRAHTVAVKDLPANDWGCYQMHGNVWEWCADVHAPYGSAAVTDPGLAHALTPPSGEAARVLRGGGWNSDARSVRSAVRGRDQQSRRSGDTGFRFVLRATS